MATRADDVAHRVENLFCPQDAGRANRRIQQPQDGALRQGLGPVGELVESAGRMHPTDHRAHRRAGDPNDVIAALPQRLDHSDVGVTPGAAAAERQCDARRRRPSHPEGSWCGHAFILLGEVPLSGSGH